MLDLVRHDREEQLTWRSVEFSEIEIGEKFMTDRWIWEKVDCESAKALAELMERSGNLLGSVFHFQPWSRVQVIEQA